MKLSPLAAVVAAVTVHFVQPAAARDQMWVVSDSTTLPFTKVVAAQAASMAHASAPVVEHAATGLAFAFLCGGTGAEHPDAASVTRRMRKREFDVCQKNGVTEIAEVPVGLDLLVLAQSNAGPPMRLTLAQLFLALGRQFPDEYGDMVLNPHDKWSEIDRTLPDTKIDVRVLPRHTGSREGLQDLLLQSGARSIPEIANRWRKDRPLPMTVTALRDEFRYIIVHETEEVIARALLARPDAVGVLGYNFLEANRAKLRGIPINGVDPTPDNAYAGKYPGTRTIYLYVRKDQLPFVPGLSKLASEHVSGAALGPGGYLLALGFMPLAIDDMFKIMTLVHTLPSVSRDMLPE